MKDYLIFFKVTPVVPLSNDSWSMSFAKYLELRFYGHQYTRRANAEPCGHSIHKDYHQYFSYNQMVASFRLVSCFCVDCSFTTEWHKLHSQNDRKAIIHFEHQYWEYLYLDIVVLVCVQTYLFNMCTENLFILYIGFILHEIRVEIEFCISLILSYTSVRLLEICLPRPKIFIRNLGPSKANLQQDLKDFSQK